MARYCSYCGKPLADNDLFCGYCGTKVTQKSQYARTETMSQAYELAKQRNDTDWSYWDSPTLFTYSPRKVEKFCIKEDKYLEKDPERPTYIVSPHGAIGQIYQEEGRTILEWIFYTETDGPMNLPQKYNQLFG